MLYVEYVKKPKNSYSSLWVNGSYAINFDSTVSCGSYQRLTLNIRDGGDVPFSRNYCCNGNLYTEGVPGPTKEEIVKAPCRDYKVDIDSS